MKMTLVTTIEEMQGGEHLVSEEFYNSLVLAIMVDNKSPLYFSHRPTRKDVCSRCGGLGQIMQYGNEVGCPTCHGTGETSI